MINCIKQIKNYFDKKKKRRRDQERMEMLYENLKNDENTIMDEELSDRIRIALHSEEGYYYGKRD